MALLECNTQAGRTTHLSRRLAMQLFPELEDKVQSGVPVRYNVIFIDDQGAAMQQTSLLGPAWAVEMPCSMTVAGPRAATGPASVTHMEALSAEEWLSTVYLQERAGPLCTWPSAMAWRMGACERARTGP